MIGIEVLLEELADDGEPRGAGEVFDAASRQGQRFRRVRRRRRVLAVSASLVATLVVVGAVAQSRATDRAPVQVGGPSAATGEATAAQLAAGHWEVIPAAPIAPRDAAQAVWTGTELVVWGGQAKPVSRALAPFYNDAAAYDPSSRTWRLLPRAPMAPLTSLGQASVWTGTEMVVRDGTHGDGAAYDPRTNAWRPLPAAPLPSTPFLTAVWTGDRALFFAGDQTAAYDPATNAWQAIAMPDLPPLEPDETHVWRAVATGEGRVLVWVQTTVASSPTVLYRYDERTDAWTKLPASSGAVFYPLDTLRAGDRALVRGDAAPVPDPNGDGSIVGEASAFYDPDTGVATPLPADTTVSRELATGYFFSAWTGKAIWALNFLGRAGTQQTPKASAFDPVANAWRRIPTAPFGCSTPTTPAWTGSSVVMYCSEPYPDQPSPVGGLQFIPG